MKKLFSSLLVVLIIVSLGTSVFASTVKYGSTGLDVQCLQAKLDDLCYNLTVDGDFGPKTLSAVKSYQSNNGLSVDGIVGNYTWKSLGSSGAVCFYQHIYCSGTRTGWMRTGYHNITDNWASSCYIIPGFKVQMIYSGGYWILGLNDSNSYNFVNFGANDLTNSVYVNSTY